MFLHSRLHPVPLGLVVLTACVAVPGTARAQMHVYQNYGAESGLSNALALAFDADGMLLVGTNDGLLRFDGLEFQPVPLGDGAEARVERLARGPDGTVWILALPGAVFRLDRDGARARPVALPAELREDLGSTPSHRRLHVDPSGRPWINVRQGGLWRFEPARSRWERENLGGARLVDFFFVGRDTMWLASTDRVGRTTLSGKPIVAWGPSIPGEITHLVPHPDGGAWIGTRDGIYRLGREGSPRLVRVGFEAWPHARPAVDAGGRLLLVGGFADTGLDVFRLGPDGAIEFPAGGDSGLRQYIWRQLLFSPEGGFWVGHESGLARIEQEALVAFPLTAPGPRLPTIKDLVESPARDELWISTWHGMYRYHDGRVERVSGLPTRAASRAVALRDGSVWWAEHQSTGFVFRNGRLSPLPRGADQVAFETTDGARYVGAADGFHRVHDGRRARIDSRPHLDGTAVEAAGRLWFTPGFVGVDTIEGDSLGSECRACLPASVRAVVDSLDQILPREMQGDPFGRVWIPTWSSSLYCLWRSPAGEWRARRFSTADGLLSDDVLSVDPTPDGRLWVGTTRGLQEFRLGPGEPALEPILEVRGRDGLDGEYVSAVREDRHGFLWLGTTGGKLHRLDPRRLVRLDSPAVRIARLELDGEPTTPGQDPPRLRAGRTRVALHLVGRTYQQPRRVHYEYRLAPRDTAWTSLGAGRVVRFPFLPPGRHVIEARAVREGRPPGPVARLALVAAPPFWRTWWFPPAVAAALLVPAFLWYRSRMERRLAMERLRLRIATDLHDDIGGGLTQVSLYGELIRRASTGTVAGWAERVGEQARALGDAMRDIVWAIHPEQESWEALELRMKDHAVALLGPRGIAFEMTGELRGGVRATVLPMDVRRNVLLVFKEALHNAVRHAGCGHVQVRWRLGPRRLGLTIHDDGGGFDPSRAGTGQGLPNLRRRAAEIGGGLSIETAPGAGTTITLEVPL